MDAILAALDALQQQRSAPQPRPVPPPQPAPPPAPPRSTQVEPPAAHPPAQPTHHTAGLLQGMFEDGNSLLRAVIAAEVLQPPLALRQEPAFWNQQPNEPSTSAS